jgi:plasmid replication initiation protein
MLDKSFLFTKSNKLINCNYDLSLQEQKIILTVAIMVQPHDSEFQEYKFRIKDLMAKLDMKDSDKSEDIHKIIRELMKKVFEIRHGNRIIQLAWFSNAEYEPDDGVVKIQFSHHLKPYMLEIKEIYTVNKLENILTLKSRYSASLYEILKSNLYKKQVIIELDELKQLVGATEKAYDSYANFKAKALDKAQEELKEKTDISFEYEAIKTCRKVTNIRFTIHSNAAEKAKGKTPAPAKEQQPSIDDIANISTVKSIIKERISDKSAIKILDAAEGDIWRVQEKYAIVSQFNKVNDIVDVMVQALREDWQSMSKTKVSTFDNFEHRVYNYDELEKKMLGWE